MLILEIASIVSMVSSLSLGGPDGTKKEDIETIARVTQANYQSQIRSDNIVTCEFNQKTEENKIRVINCVVAYWQVNDSAALQVERKEIFASLMKVGQEIATKDPSIMVELGEERVDACTEENKDKGIDGECLYRVF